MFAVVKTGGKQYKVAVDDVVKCEKLDAEVGQVVTLDNILLVGGDETAVAKSGESVKGATVKAKVLEQKRDKKVIIFKKKRRKNHRRKNGHRQSITVVRIIEISANGQTVKSDKKDAANKPKATAAAKTEKQKPAATKPAAKTEKAEKEVKKETKAASTPKKTAAKKPAAKKTGEEKATPKAKTTASKPKAAASKAKKATKETKDKE